MKHTNDSKKELRRKLWKVWISRKIPVLTKIRATHGLIREFRKSSPDSWGTLPNHLSCLFVFATTPESHGFWFDIVDKADI